MTQLKFHNDDAGRDPASHGADHDAVSTLDTRSPEARRADDRIEALLNEALDPMAVVGPPGTSERAPLDNGLSERIYAASVALLPRPRNGWSVAIRSHRVWLSFAASMAVAVSAGVYIHTTSAKPAPVTRTAQAALGAEFSSVDQQLNQLASYTGPSASIDREIATLSVKIDQAGLGDARDATPSDW